MTKPSMLKRIMLLHDQSLVLMTYSIISIIMNESCDMSEKTMMDTLTANEAKTQFGEMLLKAQRAPIQIQKNGKPVAVVVSMEEYEGMEALKLKLLQTRAAQARADIDTGNTLDGESFFESLNTGKYD